MSKDAADDDLAVGAVASKRRPLDDGTFPEGFHFLPGFFDEAAQLAIAAEVRTMLEVAPLFRQRMPKTGAPLSVRMSNAGEFGWVTDKERGYRYQSTHPQTGKAWPAIPQSLLELWSDVTGENLLPNLCLINYYDGEAKLGLHQDRGESSLDAPVVSISLGDDATFVLGGLSRKDPTRRLDLRSGDLILVWRSIAAHISWRQRDASRNLAIVEARRAVGDRPHKSHSSQNKTARIG
jgi:alkylated DNA repair protein (DNA oxidative demethylase)